MLATLFWRIVTVCPAVQIVFMHIVAIAWIYVVFMMSIAEQSVIAGIMTFLLYGVLPVSVILYLMGTPQRRRRRAASEKSQQNSGPPPDAAQAPRPTDAES